MAVGGFQWAGVARRLELHGLWTKEVERGLDLVEALMLKHEAEARQAEHEAQKRRGRKR